MPGMHKGSIMESLAEAAEEGLTPTPSTSIEQVVTLSSHEDAVASYVLLHPDLLCSINAHDGAILQLHDLPGSRNGLSALNEPQGKFATSLSSTDRSRAFLFTGQSPGIDVLPKIQAMQVSVPKSLTQGFDFQKNGTAILSSAALDEVEASHVEIFFRDQYLTRADMWRLINSQLVGRCVYRGQKVTFLNNIAVEIKRLHCDGRLVKSAYFGPTTKPIFRSKSARYVIFVQMSREMWEFDAEGSGEIMFDKVVNGFLPQLFARWKEAQVRHLVSIVFFTRMEYEHSNTRSAITQASKNAETKDFYRVVVSDTASIESADIMERLKREFQVFLRDVSLRKPEPGQYNALDIGLSAASINPPTDVIVGAPSPASRGNVLEAIQLASSQYSSDYIDRDLVRTGVSIVLISPGTGVFDVDYSHLVTITENLTENGVGIDLVCLSQMPLHSVPLFRYKQPNEQSEKQPDDSPSELGGAPSSQASNALKDGTPTSLPKMSLDSLGHLRPGSSDWSYGIPHWVDISYWSKVERTFGQKSQEQKSKGRRLKAERSRSKPFVSRVRMYELQMMGVMGEALTSFEIPCLKPSSETKALGLKSKDLASSSDDGNLETRSTFGQASASSGASRAKPTTGSLDHKSSFRAGASLSQFSSEWMDAHDEEIFSKTSKPNRGTSRATRYRQSKKISRSEAIGNLSKPAHSLASSASWYKMSTKSASKGAQSAGSTHRPSKPSLVSALHKTSNKRLLPNRKISFGPRGLAVATPTAAVAVATTDTFDFHADLRTKQDQSAVIDERLPSPTNTSKVPQEAASVIDTIGQTSPRPSVETSLTIDNSDVEASKPIPIRKDLLSDSMDDLESSDSDFKGPSTFRDRVTLLKDTTKKRKSRIPSTSEVIYGPAIPTLSPSATLAPWLTVLNPCNPSTHPLASASRLGRWQHLFPRAPKASSIKWLSLCSPASVPLTTEEFPSSDTLAEDYRQRSYTINVVEDRDSEARRTSLVSEMIAFRLARGFQIVIGNDTALDLDGNVPKRSGVFDEDLLSKEGSQVWFSRGRAIHCLQRSGSDRIEVKVFVRHATLNPQGPDSGLPVQYTPFVRSMLADTYEPQIVRDRPRRDPFHWESIDPYLMADEQPPPDQYIERLRPWQARFVLIPTNSPAESRRASRDKDLTPEESRIEGIKRLTHLWQKHRYIEPDARPFIKTKRMKEDANPLDVQYFTKNPSEIVRDELGHAAITDSSGAAGVQLLPEADFLQRSNLNLKVLSEKLQSDRGLRIVDRRWHWKLHHYCFIGSELISWIVENFKDVPNREDALDLGKDLMQDGLFRHVERRHDFLDGHYFYQFTDEYRALRVESRGLFGWGKASIPATPLKDAPTPLLRPTISGAMPDNVASDVPNDSMAQSQSTHRSSIALGKLLKFNLGHNRSQPSYREEIMNLHYDRIHNPDSCYHIRLDWMNATPKLVQNAINHWAGLIEPHGLRLVEVPIGEASAIQTIHPFRSPYTITLNYDSETRQSLVQSSIPPGSAIRRGLSQSQFHEAILKRFGYVLDFEAITAFPPEVDVTYSWGKPDYKFAQYIHRSGLLIAQVTDQDQILVLANRLYNNKGSSARAKLVAIGEQEDHGINVPRGGALRAGDGLTLRQSPRSSPQSSPALRPNLEVASTTTPFKRSPLSQISSAHQTHHPSLGSIELTTDAERMTRELQAFCEDREALRAVYWEQADRLSSSTPQTPLTSARQTPMRIPEQIVEDGGIPDLTLPSSLTETQNYFKQEFAMMERNQTASQRPGSESPSSKGVEKKARAAERSPLSKPR